jgi:hypothetical protein
MIYPSQNAPDEQWTEWLERVAPYRRPCHAELPSELRFLSSTQDREFAMLAAKCAVNSMRSRGRIK